MTASLYALAQRHGTDDGWRTVRRRARRRHRSTRWARLAFGAFLMAFAAGHAIATFASWRG